MWFKVIFPAPSPNVVLRTLVLRNVGFRNVGFRNVGLRNVGSRNAVYVTLLRLLRNVTQ